MLRLTTMGRRSGKRRHVIVSYVEHGPALAIVAMNGWAQNDPAWWLNLQASPEAAVQLPDGPRNVTARRASEEEASDFWVAHGTKWRAQDYGWRRSRETPWIILEPRPAAPHAA